MMDDTYLINKAKSKFRDAYNRGDVEQLLSVFDEEGFTDMSGGVPSFFNKDATEALRERATKLFAEYHVRLAVIVIEITVDGNLAYDYGWHEFTLRPKGEGEVTRQRHRYVEVWKKNSSGEWRISAFINNPDVREEFSGHRSHWFLSEEGTGDIGSSAKS
jgi:ketosteroid isomerase-like protein